METILQSIILSPQQVLRVFYATCSAVAAMHSQSPAIIHRDIKVRIRGFPLPHTHTRSHNTHLIHMLYTYYTETHHHTHTHTHAHTQVENLILTGEGVIKLCDFGSATTQQVNPEPSWTAVQRGLAEEEVRS